MAECIGVGREVYYEQAFHEIVKILRNPDTFHSKSENLRSFLFQINKYDPAVCLELKSMLQRVDPELDELFSCIASRYFIKSQGHYEKYSISMDFIKNLLA